MFAHAVFCLLQSPHSLPVPPRPPDGVPSRRPLLQSASDDSDQLSVDSDPDSRGVVKFCKSGVAFEHVVNEHDLFDNIMDPDFDGEDDAYQYVLNELYADLRARHLEDELFIDRDLPEDLD